MDHPDSKEVWPLASTALLHDVPQLVGEEPLNLRTSHVWRTRSEDDVVADGERKRPHIRGRLTGARAFLDQDAREDLTEARFQQQLRGRFEGPHPVLALQSVAPMATRGFATAKGTPDG